jgi:hypothetical protein
LPFHPFTPEGAQASEPRAHEAWRGAFGRFSFLSVLPMNEITRNLSPVEQGDLHAAEQLLPLVYKELRKLAAQKLAQEKPGQTL